MPSICTCTCTCTLIRDGRGSCYSVACIKKGRGSCDSLPCINNIFLIFISDGQLHRVLFIIWGELELES